MGAVVKVAGFRSLILTAFAGVAAMAVLTTPAFSAPSEPPAVLPPPAVIPPPFPFPSPDKLAVPGEGARGGWSCTSSGYATPRYGFNGRNMDGPAPVEAASPCTPPEVNAALDAAGLARDGRVVFSYKNVIGLQFMAKGSFAVNGSKLEKVDNFQLQGDFTKPATRLLITRGDKTDIRVSNGTLAWTEATEGGDAAPVKTAAAMAREQEIMLKLTPFGALWSVIEAEGRAKVSKDKAGATVLEGISPYDGLDVFVSLNKDGLPGAVTVKDGKTTYGATFTGYQGTPNPQKIDWEPFYYLWFPNKITWTKNGKPLADFEVYGFFSNPYVVFPIPANLKAATPVKTASK